MNSTHVSSTVNERKRQGATAAGARFLAPIAAHLLLTGLAVAGVTLATGTASQASATDDQDALTALDVKYQKAVEANDATTMAAILADDFILVEGDGKRSTKRDLLNDATSGRTHYNHQIDSERTILVSGDTAVVTAKLWAKGIEDGRQVDYALWFSDVYVRTSGGWRYIFGQASLPLPRNPPH